MTGDLPADVEACHALILKQQQLIDGLQHQVEQLLRHRYGRRSEKLDPEQMRLFQGYLTARWEEAVEPEPPAQAAGEAPEGESPKPGKHRGRKPLPAHLPRQRVEHDVPVQERACPDCGEPREKIGEDVSEQLEYVPASLVVLQHVRMKYACRRCQGHVVVADKPYQPIEKGLPGPGLLAHVVTGKYGDSLPLYRQEGILARHGVEVSRQTTCGWCAASARLLEPLWDLMKLEVLAGRKVHTDDTPVPVLDPGRGRTKTGRMWVYVGDASHRYTVFDYTPNRRRDGPVAFLGDYEGYLQADAFAGYDGIYATKKVVEVACWAHARRKFELCLETDQETAGAALAWIGRLYEVETAARGLGDEERRQVRGERSAPVLESFGSWLEKRRAEVLPKSPLGLAIRYVLRNWKALNRYLEDGALEIDNNTAERAVRCIAVGRKNWEFAGSDNGGRTAAVLFTMTQTCKDLGIDPFAYLRDVFARLSAHPASRRAELLPDRWKPVPREEPAAQPAGT